MDHAHPYLNESIQVLRMAGIRHVLKREVASEQDLLGTEPWVRILGRIPPSPRFIWTYDELGDDLLGVPNKLRGQLWRRVIAGLRLPPGSVGFLPYNLPSDNGLILQFAAFAQALCRIRPAMLIVFSSRYKEQLLQCMDRLQSTMDIPPSLLFAEPPEILLELDAESFEPVLDQFSRQWNLSERSA